MKVLILTASYGSGHVIAAKALDEEFREKNIRPAIFDLVLEGGKTERNAAAFYEFLMRRGHFVWKIFHDKIMPIRRGNSIRKIYELIHRKRFFKEIEKFSPDIIVSTMDTAGLVSSLYKKEHSSVKIYTVITDYVVHPIWVWKNMDGYFVGSEQAQKYLENHGIEKDKFTISRIPIRAQFSKKISKVRAREELGIPQEKVILISAGSFGSVPVEEILKSIPSPLDTLVMIIAGREKVAIEDYAYLLEKHGISGKVVDYVQNIEVFMRASDLYISKAGGLTVAECFASGLPAIYLKNFPGHEIGNALYAEENGAAIVIQDNNNLKTVLAGLLSDKEKLMKMSEHALKVARVQASKDVVSAILNGLM